MEVASLSSTIPIFRVSGERNVMTSVYPASGQALTSSVLLTLLAGLWRLCLYVTMASCGPSQSCGKSLRYGAEIYLANKHLLVCLLNWNPKPILALFKLFVLYIHLQQNFSLSTSQVSIIILFQYYFLSLLSSIYMHVYIMDLCVDAQRSGRGA